FQRQLFTSAHGRHAAGNQAEVRAKLIPGADRRRLDVDDAARARAVLDRKAPAEHFDTFDGRRIDRADETLEVLEMKRIEQADSVISNQDVFAERAAD